MATSSVPAAALRRLTGVVRGPPDIARHSLLRGGGRASAGAATEASIATRADNARSIAVSVSTSSHCSLDPGTELSFVHQQSVRDRRPRESCFDRVIRSAGVVIDAAGAAAP